MHTSYVLAVLIGGSIAGALDIAFAISFAAYSGVAPLRLLQTVASGLLGMEAFSGGVPVAVLGLALHFGMSFLWAGLFLVLASLVPSHVHYPVASGIAFGIAVFLAMRLLVLPLSAFPYPVTFAACHDAGSLVSCLLFGVPIAWAARRALIAVSSAA